jgi:hypothetical protein
MAMPLLVEEISYQAILDSFVDHDHVPSRMVEEDLVLRPVWATSLSYLHDFLDETFPLDKAIIEAMNFSERPRFQRGLSLGGKVIPFTQSHSCKELEKWRHPLVGKSLKRSGGIASLEHRHESRIQASQ